MQRFAPLLVALGLLAAGTASAAAPPDLLISEYVEGSSTGKAIELYNGTGAVIDLDAGAYTLQIFFNGSPAAGAAVALTGTVAPGGVLVVGDDRFSGPHAFNGDDAVVLFRGTTVVDALGQIGADPGTEWGAGLASTTDNTLRREGAACTPDTDPLDAFDPAAHFVGYPTNTYDGLGAASLDCTLDVDMIADIEPVGGPVLVPATGGPVSYTIYLENTADEPLMGCVWIMAALPDETVVGALRGPVLMTLDPGETVGPVQFTDTVRPDAPAGTYHLMVHVGGHATRMVLYADHFAFQKAAADGREGGSPTAQPFNGSPFAPVAGVLPGPTVATAGNAPGVREVATYPNPARGGATIRFDLEAAADVRLAVYDLLGREVALLANGALEAGSYEAAFDGSSLPAGAYVWRLIVGDHAQTGRLALVK